LYIEKTLMKKYFILPGIVLISLSLLILASCNKEENFDDNPDLKLGFSTDTIFFDTVFTTIGSSSRVFMIYNPSNEKINISSIKLARGNNSPFRVNVDGIASTEIEDFEIAAKDSAFVFVKVTIDPANTNNPLVQTDSLVFLTNGNIQDVKLVAWGQDAYFYRNSILGSNYTFSADKPHVIYGFLIVDSLYTLNVEAGSRIYMHSGSVLLAYRDASLKINGTKENPVSIQGDRLEADYQDVSGQWGRIWLYAGSINNEINYAIIKNGEVGVHVDTTGNSPNPTLRISNTQIYNMSNTGILAQGSTIEAANCVIGNCGNRSVALTLGGKYDFRHCTLGNFWNRTFRRETALVLNNYYIDTSFIVQLRPLEMAYFGNCVIYGDKVNEVTIDQHSSGGILNFQFDHCLLKTDMDIADQNKFPGSLKNEDPWFRDPQANEYQPDTLISALINKGSNEILIETFTDISKDIDQNSRILDNAPDLGAYEFQEAVLPKRFWRK
jgi:hypothetical protein